MKNNANFSSKPRDNLSINWSKMINSLVMIGALVSSTFVFAIPIPVNAVASLNIFGSDGIQHNTVDIEEDYGSVGVGTDVVKNLKVKANGLAKKQTMIAQWSCTVGDICSRVTLVPTSTEEFGKPFGGTSGQPLSEIPFTLTLTIPPDMEGGTYHGKLEATGTVVQTGEVATPGFYFFVVTIIADAEPPVVTAIDFSASPGSFGQNGWFNADDFTAPNSVTGTVSANDNITVDSISCTANGTPIVFDSTTGYGTTSASATFTVIPSSPYTQGTNTVSCTASDGTNTSSEVSATIKIDTVLPIIVDPGSIIIDEESAGFYDAAITGSPGAYFSNPGNGAVFAYVATASDPDSNSVPALGSGPFDFGAPSGADYTVDGGGAVTVNFSIAPGSFECFPGSGAVFGEGVTDIKCQAIDNAGNVADPLVSVNFDQDVSCYSYTDDSPSTFGISCGGSELVTVGGETVPLLIRSELGTLTVIHAGLSAQFNWDDPNVLLFHTTDAFIADPSSDPGRVTERWGLNQVTASSGILGTPVTTTFNSIESACFILDSPPVNVPIGNNQPTSLEEEECDSGSVTLKLNAGSELLIIKYTFNKGAIKVEVIRANVSGDWRPTQTDIFNNVGQILASGAELVVEPKPLDSVVPGGSSGIVYPSVVYGGSEVTGIILDGASSSSQGRMTISNPVPAIPDFSPIVVTDVTGEACNPPSNQCIKYEPKALVPDVPSDTTFDILLELLKITGTGKKNSRVEVKTVLSDTLTVKETPESYQYLQDNEVVVSIQNAFGLATDADGSGDPDYRTIINVDPSCSPGNCTVTQTAIYGIAPDFRAFRNFIDIDPGLNAITASAHKCHSSDNADRSGGSLKVGNYNSVNRRCAAIFPLSSASAAGLPSDQNLVTSPKAQLYFKAISKTGSPPNIGIFAMANAGSPTYADEGDGNSYGSISATGTFTSLKPFTLGGTAGSDVKSKMYAGGGSWGTGFAADASANGNYWELSSFESPPSFQLKFSFTCGNGKTTLNCT
jgi:hypothetical protein